MTLVAFRAIIVTEDELLEVKAVQDQYGFVFVEVRNEVVATREVFADTEEFGEWVERLGIREVLHTGSYYKQLALAQ